MNKSILLKSLVTILVVIVFGLTAVGCEYVNNIINKDNNVNDGTIDDGNTDDNVGDGNTDDNDSTDEVVSLDKSALLAELSLEVAEQGDYTDNSYNAYLAKLQAAKNVAADEAATQENVDKASADLTAARMALKIRSVSMVQGASKEIKLVPGDTREITLADYVNDNALSKITYEIKSDNESVIIGEVVDGKFTITAGDVSEPVDAKLSIAVYYDGTVKLETELSVKITHDVSPTLYSTELLREIDVLNFAGDRLSLDFAENVNNAGNLELSFSVKCGDETLALDGATYTFALGSYTEDYTYVTFNVTVSYVANGVQGSLEYTYKLGIRDTGNYNVKNGGFENGLEGWTSGGESFGGTDDRSTFWAQEFPMFNVGQYFSSENDDKGSLASSYFTVNSKYATYMLGAAGKANVYITVEDAEGNVLALYRNTKFADLPAGVENWDEQRQLIGVSVFVCNFVTYKVDISAFEGQKVRFVIHDYEEGNGGFGFVLFDELNAYYASLDDVPENAVLAENLLADKSALNAELALEVKEQGDYTLDSFNAYLEKLAAAKALLGDITVAQADVDNAAKALTSARESLAVRPVLAVDGANKSFRLTSGNSKALLFNDYINTNGLSNLSIALDADSDALAIVTTDDGFTLIAGEVGKATDVKVTITVSYKNEAKLTVELTVQITNDTAPVVYNKEISKSYDVYALENKEGLVIDLAANVDNAGNLPLSFTVNGVTADPTYTFTFGKYTEAVTNETLNIVVGYVANGEMGTLEFTYKLAMTDTTAYRLVNGGFESDLYGWTVVGNIGDVSSDRNYWVNDPEVPSGFEFGMDGEKMFSAYAPGALESAVGTLTSSTFKVGGSGWVSFKLGAARDNNYVYVDVVDATTKQILARYYNGLWAERTNDMKSGCTLIAYKADLSAFMGKEVFFRISDNADSGYGLFFVDSFITYYETEPENFNDAVAVPYALPGTIYDVFNGGFEMGDVQGWWNIGEIGVVTNATGYWGDNIPYGKNGEFLFTGVESFGADTMREGNRGVLTSSVFEIGGTGYISFMLGGGGNPLCYVQVVDAVTGEVLARYHQQEMQDAVLKSYVADLSAYIGRTVRIQVVDQAESGWGCVSFDNLVTYHTTVPQGIVANDIKGELKYTIENGSFETGNIDGWHQNIWETGAHNTLGWVLQTEIDAGWYTKNDDKKDGNYLLTFAQPGDINCENTKGTLESSTFSLKQGAFVSFKFGGAGTRAVRIELCRADGSVIATFYNEAPGKINTEMHSYYYQYNGPEVNCFFRIVDDSTSNYGCFVVDDFRVNLESAPDGFIPAIQ